MTAVGASSRSSLVIRLRPPTTLSDAFTSAPVVRSHPRASWNCSDLMCSRTVAAALYSSCRMRSSSCCRRVSAFGLRGNRTSTRITRSSSCCSSLGSSGTVLGRLRSLLRRSKSVFGVSRPLCEHPWPQGWPDPRPGPMLQRFWRGSPELAGSKTTKWRHQRVQGGGMHYWSLLSSWSTHPEA